MFAQDAERMDEHAGHLPTDTVEQTAETSRSDSDETTIAREPRVDSFESASAICMRQRINSDARHHPDDWSKWRHPTHRIGGPSLPLRPSFDASCESSDAGLAAIATLTDVLSLEDECVFVRTNQQGKQQQDSETLLPLAPLQQTSMLRVRDDPSSRRPVVSRGRHFARIQSRSKHLSRVLPFGDVVRPHASQRRRFLTLLQAWSHLRVSSTS